MCVGATLGYDDDGMPGYAEISTVQCCEDCGVIDPDSLRTYTDPRFHVEEIFGGNPNFN